MKRLTTQNVLSNFMLAGGTSLSLRFNHRVSVDLDFFTVHEFSPETLLESLESLINIDSYSIEKNTLNVFSDGVKIDFIAHRYSLLKEYEIIDEVKLFSLEDVSAMKMSAIGGRGSKKDFIDVNLLLEHFSLRELLDLFHAKYPKANTIHLVKALTYFDDANLEDNPIPFNDKSWSKVEKRILKAVVNLTK